MGSVNKGDSGRQSRSRRRAAIYAWRRRDCQVQHRHDGSLERQVSQRQEQTEWHNVDLWGKQAESLKEYLTKGKQVFVEGRLQSRKAPRCRNCDAFLPERDWRPGDRDQKLRCQKCDHETVPHVQAMMDVRAERITLLGGGGGRGTATDRGGDGMSHVGPAAMEAS